MKHFLTKRQLPFAYCIQLLAVCLVLTGLTSCQVKKKDDLSEEKQPLFRKELYTCPMHPKIIRDKPGTCPICGMDLVKKETSAEKINDISLNKLLQPTNEFVISSIPVTTIEKREQEIEINAFGVIAYDTRQVGSISARISGRIEKLYVRYRFQKVSKGQKVMDIYSPEILTDEQNLLFLLKKDPSNVSMIESAKQRLLLSGMSNEQLQSIIRLEKPSLTISVYSSYSGHIHEALENNTQAEPGKMNDVSIITEEIGLREGMYVQKGQTIFSVYDPSRAWALLSIYAEDQALVKVGNAVKIVPETNPEKYFRATIDFIEPFFSVGSKTMSARVYFNNTGPMIPIGSQVRATIYGNTRNAYWLPKDAVLSLGLKKIVFLKEENGFKAHNVETGLTNKNYIQVISGLTSADSVAMNAQYLSDSESFLKTNE